MSVCCCFRHFAGNFTGQNADVYQSTYEQELRDYGYSQRERREQTSPVGSDYRAESTASFSRSTSARQRSPSYERHDSYDERYYGDCYRDTDSQADDRESVWSQRSGGGSSGRKRDSHEKYDDRYVVHKHLEDGSSKDASAVHGFSPLGSEHSHRSRDVKYRSSHSKSPVSGRKDKDRGSRRGTTPPTPTDDDFPLGGKGSAHGGSGGGVDPKEVKHKLLKITKHDKDAGMDVQMQDVCNNVDTASKGAKATPSVYRSSGDVRSQVGKPRKRALDETESLAKKPCVRDRAAISLKVEEYISRQKKAFEKKKLDQIARSDKTNDVGDEPTSVKTGDDSVAATEAKHLPAARGDGADRTATCNASSPSSKTSSEPDVECESVAGSDVLNLEKEKRQLLRMLEQLDETGSVSDEQGASVAALELEVSRHLKKPKLDGVAGIEREPSSLVMKLQRDIAKLPSSTDSVETTSQLVTDMIAVSNSGDSGKHADYSKFEPIDTTRSFRKQMEARRRVEEQDGTAVRVADGGKREQKRTACKFNPPPPLKHIECCDDEQVPATDEYTSLAEVPAEFKSKKRRKSAAVPEVDTFTKLKRSYRTRNANAMLSSGDEGDEQSEKAELAAKQEKVLEDIVTLLTEHKHRDQPGKGELKSPHSSRRESKNPPRIIPDSVVIGGGGDGKAESNGPQEPRKMPRGRRRGSPMSLPLPRFAFETCWSPRQSPKHSVKPSDLTGSPKERSPMGSKINSPSFSPGCQHSPTVAPQKTLPSMPQPPSPALTPPPPPPPPVSRGTTDTPLKPQLSSTEGTALVSVTRPLVVDTGQGSVQGPVTQQLDVASPSPAATVAAPPPLHTAATQQAETVICQLSAVSPSMADGRTDTDDTVEVKPSTPDEPPTQLISESESTQDSVPAVSQENAGAEPQPDTTSAPVTDNDTKTVNHKDHASVDKPEKATPSNVLSPKLDSSDTDLSELGSPNQPSLEEQIRALDEKLSLTAAAVHAVKMPDTSALSLSDYRERFRVKRRTDAPLPPTTAVAMPPKPEPSDIAKSLLARNSIFDQDSKRLKQINEKYEMRGVRGMSVDEPVRTSRDVTGLEYEALTTPVFGAIGRQSSAPGSTMQQVLPVSLARAMTQPKSAPPASSVGEKGFSYNGRTLGSPRVVAANSIAVETPYLQNATSSVHSSQQNSGPLTAFGAGVSAATAAKLKLSPASDSQDGKLVINLSPVSQTGSSVTTCVSQKPAQSPVRPSEPTRLKPILCQTSGQCVTSNSVTSNSQRWTDNPQKPPLVVPTTNPVAPGVNADVSKPKDPHASPSVTTSLKKPVRDFGESSHSKKDAPSVPKQKSVDEHTNVDKTKARTKEVCDTPTKIAQKGGEAKNESTSSAKTSGEPANKKPKLQSDKKDKKHSSMSKSDDNPSSGSGSSKKCVSTTSAVSKPGSAVKCNKVVAKDNAKRADEKDRNREHGKHADKSKPHSSGLVKDKQQKSRDDSHEVVRQDSSGKDKRHSKPKERIEKEKDVAKSDRSETQKSASVAERTECKDAVKSVVSGDMTKLDRIDHVKCESLPSDKPEHKPEHKPEQEDKTGPETDGAASTRDQHKGVKLEKRDSKSKDRGSDGKHSKTSDGKPSKERTKEQHSGHDGKPKSKLNNKVVDKQKNRTGKPVDSAKDSRCSKGEKEKCGKERSERDKDRKGDKGQQRDREHSGNPKKATETPSASKEKSDRSHHKVDDEKHTTSNPPEKTTEKPAEKSSKTSSSKTSDDRPDKANKSCRSEKSSKQLVSGSHSGAADSASASARTSSSVCGSTSSTGGAGAGGADGRGRHNDRRPSGTKENRSGKSKPRDDRDEKSKLSRDSKQDKKSSSSLMSTTQHQEKTPKARVRRESKSCDENRELKQLHAELNAELIDEWSYCSMYDRLKRRSNKEKTEDGDGKKLSQVNVAVIHTPQ